MSTLRIFSASAILLLVLSGCSKTEVVPGQAVQSTQVVEKNTESDSHRTVSAPSQPKINVQVSQPASAPVVTQTEKTVIRDPGTKVVTSSSPSN